MSAKEYKLHKHQMECLLEIEKTFKHEDKQLIQLPTGAGKTFVFINYLIRNSESALIICPSIELQDQIISWCKKFGITSIQKNAAHVKLKKTKFYCVTAASLNFKSTREHLYRQNFDTIVIDEAHHSQAVTYLNFLSEIPFKYKLLGCTATPERLDKKNLLDVFNVLSFSRNLLDLIREDLLCDFEATRIRTGIKLFGGRVAKDFSPIQLKALDESTRNKVIIDTYQKYCTEVKTLIFCINIEHAEKIANFLKEKGYSASSIHGQKTPSERRNILEKFKSGEIKVLTNVQLLTEGFDEPSIECLMICRPTKSKGLYFQMLGRGVRKFPGKKYCRLFELTDNCHDICTFSVACGMPIKLNYDYKERSSLEKIYEEAQKIDFENVEIKPEKYNLFSSINVKEIYGPVGNSIDILHSIFNKVAPSKNQKEQLKNHPFIEELTCLEAAFLIWKEKAKEKYGTRSKEKKWKS
jgi:superfamily II DNA or RNA helicase